MRRFAALVALPLLATPLGGCHEVVLAHVAIAGATITALVIHAAGRGDTACDAAPSRPGAAPGQACHGTNGRNPD